MALSRRSSPSSPCAVPPDAGLGAVRKSVEGFEQPPVGRMTIRALPICSPPRRGHQSVSSRCRGNAVGPGRIEGSVKTRLRQQRPGSPEKRGEACASADGEKSSKVPHCVHVRAMRSNSRSSRVRARPVVRENGCFRLRRYADAVASVADGNHHTIAGAHQVRPCCATQSPDATRAFHRLVGQSAISGGAESPRGVSAMRVLLP